MIGGNRMFRSWKFIFLIAVSVILLTGCNQSLEERATDGVQAAEKAFNSNHKKPTEKLDGIKLYKPAGFVVSEGSDAQNIIFKKNNETFILFVNPNEEQSSRLFYDLLVADQSKETVAIETFTEDGVFGFAAVVQSDSENVELITSVGGAKMTTLSKESKIVGHLTSMMEVVRSIK